jgi:excinuclease ABC subunit A
MDEIVIRGARQHNLKNISLNIPRNRFVVITGVSGSGKSSLAFDTLFAEGHRRYVEALSSFARQFLQRLDPPDVDEISGLSPAIAIEQKGLPRNPRSTVGTLTEIHDYLRLLFARLSSLFCPLCGRLITAYSIARIVEEICKRWPAGSRMLILAPLGRRGAKELPMTLRKLRREGFVRIRLDGEVYELDPLPAIALRPDYQLEVVVDRLVLSGGGSQRLSDSLEVASRVGGEEVVVVQMGGEERRFSEAFRCTACGLEFSEATPSLFSFHHPAGMCATCKGLGFGSSSLGQIEGSGGRKSRISRDIDEAKSWQDDLPSVAIDDEDLVECPDCKGTRFNPMTRAWRLGGLSIDEVSRMPMDAFENWLSGLELETVENEIAARPRQEITSRLNTLKKLGLSYLTLDRSARTLSGGEAQRIRLATQVGNPLSGVLYVLDEPSIGLHPRDHDKLLELLLRLRDSGNSVLVVEHDRQTILRADCVVDMGPGAGLAGGEVMFCGPPDELIDHPTSLTGLYLSDRRTISPPQRRHAFRHGALEITGATGNNLKGIHVRFPLQCMTCITGVSGSGKSTLVLDTVYKTLARKLYRSKSSPAPCESLQTSHEIRRLVLIDQSPLGRTPRSTPATYTGLFTLIRQLFARVPEARARGYDAGRFSFNAKGGRCEVCKGEGLQSIEMYFLPNVYVTCPVCKGSRFQQETLEVLFKGCSIADVLKMNTVEAMSLFENVPSIRRKLEMLQEVGLGYLLLGQPATTLSGGEAQRVKLAAELAGKSSGQTLYILDEPTTGLHFDDINRLLHLLQRLVDRGNTVLVIEHHLDVIKTADYVVDLGPEGGEGGGRVVACGTPEEITGNEQSITGRYLRGMLA